MAPCSIMFLSELSSDLTSKWMKSIIKRIQHFKTLKHEMHFLWDCTSFEVLSLAERFCIIVNQKYYIENIFILK